MRKVNTMSDHLERLWTPYRMAYVTGTGSSGPDSEGCPLCAIPDLPPEESLVVARGDVAYVVLNLHPYNPGHLMVLPYRHVAGYEELTDDEAAEVTSLTQNAIRTIRGVSQPHAFNVGMNLGGVAGGSLADHLHQHVVPRWSGDANFMTLIADTKVMPQLLADTRSLIEASWPSSIT